MKMIKGLKLFLIVSIVAVANLISLSSASDQSVDINVNVTDIISPANVVDFKAIAGDSHISLTWILPNDDDLAGVKIQRSESYYPSNKDDGVTIFDALGTSFVDTGLKNGVRYYYTAFAYDTSGNYATGSIASAVPATPSVDRGIDQGEKIILPISKGEESKIMPKSDIELSDFLFYVLFDKGPVEVKADELGKLMFIKGTQIIIVIPKNIFAKEVNVITVTLGESSYLFKLSSDGSLYQTIIQVPSQKGNFDLNFIIVYKDGTIKNIKTDVLIDPAGYVYSEKRGIPVFWDINELRIKSAEVILYQLIDGDWQLWDASKYNQDNPIVTDETGEFFFMVPKGTYYLEAKKSGFGRAKTDPFEVDDKIVNTKILMKSNYRYVWYLLIGLLLAATVIISGKYWKRRYKN